MKTRWFDDSEQLSTLPVRAIIAVIFTLGVTGGFFLGLLNTADYKELALVALMWYFAKRSAQDNEGDGGSNGNTPGDEAIGFEGKHPVVNVHSSTPTDVNVTAPTSTDTTKSSVGKE